MLFTTALADYLGVLGFGGAFETGYKLTSSVCPASLGGRSVSFFRWGLLALCIRQDTVVIVDNNSRFI